MESVRLLKEQLQCQTVDDCYKLDNMTRLEKTLESHSKIMYSKSKAPVDGIVITCSTISITCPHTTCSVMSLYNILYVLFLPS